MATPNSIFSLTGFAKRLVDEQVLEESQVTRLQADSSLHHKSFYRRLIDSRMIEAEQLTLLGSGEFGVPILDIRALDLQEAPVSLIPASMIQANSVLPLYSRGTKLFVGVADPADSKILDDIKFQTGMGVESILINPEHLGKAIELVSEQQDSTLMDLENLEELDDIDMAADEEETTANPTDHDVNNDTPVVRFVNKLLLDAIRKGASDIHIEPFEQFTRIRLRIDGILNEVARPTNVVSPRIIARIKILSRLDIAERRVPQDGRMKMRLSKSHSIDFRVSSLPTLFGEKIVIRILDATQAKLGVKALGFEAIQESTFVDAMHRPYGMILVTGPTGSGKTVTLYTALQALNSPDINLCSVEDPVEINVEGINQVNINERANLTFAIALRAFLRQDPDIVMVGEIRDLETAEISIKASQTGHLVLSTLHTNDAPSTLTRLLNMGVEPFNVASSIHLIIAQRLVRKLCEHCKEPANVPENALLKAGFSTADLENLTVFKAIGCEQCTRGFRGRTGIFQVLPIGPEISEQIMRGGNETDIEEIARSQDILNLRQSGLLKVKAGITSLEEIERVTNS